MQVVEMIKTESGKVSGAMTSDKAVIIFKGIPYAASPEGRLRWKAPEKFPSWPNIRECTNFSPSAIQPPQSPFLMWTEEFIIDTSRGYSEDSLSLNIFCPSDVNVKGKPVIVYFHGGNFVSGGNSYDIYDGEQLARHGVIFVVVNFRVGILGLLSCSELSSENPEKISGNYQLLDQIAALKWVRDNIASFGGDPENVTIMGQSSGAASVCTLSVSPMACNLFRRVFAMSHDTLNMPISFVPDDCGRIHPVDLYKPQKECESEGDKVLCGRSIDEMRSLPPSELLKMPEFYSYSIDGHVLTGTFKDGVMAGLTDKYDFMLTYTYSNNMWSDCGMFAIMTDVTNKESYESSMCNFFGENADRAMRLYPFTGNAEEFVLRISHDRYAASMMMLAMLRRKSNTWLGEFRHVMPGPESDKWGAFHTSDVPYWLNHFSDVRKEYWRDEDYELGNELVTRLAGFAKTGRPEADNLPSWKPSDGNSLYIIGAGVMKEIQPLDDERNNLWREVYCVN